MDMVEKLQALFETYRVAHPFDGTPRGLYDPVNYVMDLGGKRLRPAMVLLGYRMFDAEVEKALPLAYAVEVFHNFTLVHDDIMDAAPLRRGNPTVHTAFDVNRAILSGDVMLILAYEYLMQLPRVEFLPAVLRVFNQVAREVCEGQQLDMEFETRTQVAIPEYIRMIELKTAVLLAGSLAIGAMAAGANAEDAQRLYDFGRFSGIAFQLQDDMLDAFGDTDKVGKRIGGDIAQNKKTFLWLKALELASPAQLTEWQAACAPGVSVEDKIRRILQVYQELGIQEFAQKEKQYYMELALQQLRQVKGADADKAILEQLADRLLNREF